MKLWIDDVRQAPNMYIWLRSVDEAKECIEFLEEHLAMVSEELRPFSNNRIELIDIDHDAGVENMRAIIRRNGWKEVF